MSDATPIAQEVILLAERLQAQGYATLGVVNGAFLSPRFGFGRGFDRDHPSSPSNWRAHQASVLRVVRTVARRPVFLFFHYMRVHDPYDPRPRFDRFRRPYEGVPTVLDLLGLPPDRNLDGRSLRKYWESDTDPDPARVLTLRTSFTDGTAVRVGVRTRDTKLVIDRTRETTLYFDLGRDPGEAAGRANAPEAAWLRGRVADLEVVRTAAPSEECAGRSASPEGLSSSDSARSRGAVSRNERVERPSQRRQLRQALDRGHFVLAPFVYDGLQARLAEDAGFEAVYMTGFGTAAARGLPDLGLLTATEMAENVRTLAGSVSVPVICDADTGYGNALNVARTIRDYEGAGAAALHLEDQKWPKRCGFLDGKEVISQAEMLPKLRAALDARSDPDLIVIARTDALQPEGWDEAERRARAYAEAGADLVFVDGIRSVADLDVYAERLADLPRLYNGQLLPPAEIEARGFRVMIHTGTLAAAFDGIRRALRELRETGRILGAEDPRVFAELIRVLGVSDALERAKRYEG